MAVDEETVKKIHSEFYKLCNERQKEIEDYGKPSIEIDAKIDELNHIAEDILEINLW